MSLSRLQRGVEARLWIALVLCDDYRLGFDGLVYLVGGFAETELGAGYWHVVSLVPWWMESVCVWW